MLGCCSLADDADLAEEPVEHAGPLDQVPADDLEHLVAAHEPCSGPGRPRPCRRGPARGRSRSRGGRPAPAAACRPAAEPGPRGPCSSAIRRIATRPDVDLPAGFWARGAAPGIRRTTARQPAAGSRALLQVLADRLGRGIVELAQAVRRGSGRSGGPTRGRSSGGLRVGQGKRDVTERKSPIARTSER